MLGRTGLLAAGTADIVSDKLERAIEDLRVKYERKAEEEAAAAAKKKEETAARDAEEARRIEAAKEPSMVMEDADLEALRRERIAALRESAASRKRDLEAGHGQLSEITEEEFLREVTGTQLVAVHFYHPEFESCKVLDKHLRILAPKVTRVKMLRLNAEKAPFFTAKLKVRVLPSLVFFKDGLAIGRQTGLEGLTPASDARPGTLRDISTKALYRCFCEAGMTGVSASDVGEGDTDDEDADSRGRDGPVSERELAAMRAAAMAKVVAEL